MLVATVKNNNITITYNMTGSKWSKWDLHFHTQTSYDYENKSVSNQEIIETLVFNKVELVAITDHHTIDIERIKELQRLSNGKITILPGIEFLSDARGKEPVHFIGIFSEKCDLDFVWGQLKNNTSLKRIQSEGKKPEEIYCDLFDTIKLIKELKGIVTIHAGSKGNGIENITHSLPHSLAQKEDIAKAIDVFELGKTDDFEEYRLKVLPYIKKTIGKSIPTVICSDNHNIKKYSTKQNLWIKSLPTFEGLKQILYEPKYRVHIGENAPINPPIRINKVSFNFPSNSYFEGEPFCLSGKNEIHFSPNFTCLIGGRGTGKSTILNLIHEKLKSGENQFFKNRKIKDSDDKIIPIDDFIEIDNDSDEKYIEFLSQNEIEDFAQDYQKLTNAIYSRILKRDTEGNILKNEKALNEKLDLFKINIINKRRLVSLNSGLDQLQKELETNKKIIDSFSSKEYTEINDAIKTLSKDYNDLNYSKGKYFDLLKELEELSSKYKIPQHTKSLYLNETIRLVKEINKLVEDSKKTDFSEVQKQRNEYETKITQKKVALTKYLSDKGLTEENLKDISNSSIIANNLESEIVKKKDDIEDCEKRIESFDKSESIEVGRAYKEELEQHIVSISSILEKLESTSVKPISLHFEFDTLAAHDRVFNDFKLVFEGQINKSNHKGDGILREILFSQLPENVTDKESLLESIRKNYSSSSAKNFLLELLNDETNFESYKLVCERSFMNFAEFKRIKVLYDNRPIENSSFGQRCTAVLVILLLLGNNPIIIDEPEAHLDSLLISDYLVDVIKDKKQNRQIIFATHNANFVVNGDAELIHILKINEASKTSNILSTTIENEETKDVLIGLEGGREAFIRRENKYQ